MNQDTQRTILVVDDTPANIDVLKGILSERYKVQAAINGKIALKIIEKKKPDLVLLDLMMPEMDGYQVNQHLKGDKETKEIPVIFVSAKGENVDKEKVESSGAVDYITKPVNPEELLSSIANYV